MRDAQVLDDAANRRKETEQLRELDDGTQGTVKGGSKAASRGTSSSNVSKRRSEGASRSSSTTESAALQPDEGERRVKAAISSIAGSVAEYIRVSIATAASIPDADGSRTEDGKYRVTAAASRLNRSTSQFSRRLERLRRISRERTEQFPRNLAVAPNGAASTSVGTGEEPATASDEFDIAGQLERFGAAVERFNAELESERKPVRAAGDGSRRENLTTRPNNSRTSAATGWSQADVNRQVEQLSLILDSIRRQRESEIEELEKRRAELERLTQELAAGSKQLESTNEFDRAGVEESGSTEEMALKLSEFSRRNRELAESSFNLTSGIRRLSAELAGSTVGHLLKTDGKREQSTEAQAIGHSSFGEESFTNPEERRATGRNQQLHQTARNAESESSIGDALSVRNQKAGTVRVDPKMREDADLIVSIAARVYNYLDNRQQVTFVSPGVMVAEITDYTLSLQPEDEIFSIAAKDGRGEIVRYEGDDLKRVRSIQPSDVEQWVGIERKLDKIEMKQQEAERQKEVERQQNKQKKRDQLSL